MDSQSSPYKYHSYTIWITCPSWRAITAVCICGFGIGPIGRRQAFLTSCNDPLCMHDPIKFPRFGYLSACVFLIPRDGLLSQALSSKAQSLRNVKAVKHEHKHLHVIGSIRSCSERNGSETHSRCLCSFPTCMDDSTITVHAFSASGLTLQGDEIIAAGTRSIQAAIDEPAWQNPPALASFSKQHTGK